jgi:hypothetical protein
MQIQGSQCRIVKLTSQFDCGFATARGSLALWLCALTAAFNVSISTGCGTPHAILNFNAPSSVIAGSPFTVTVTATINGKPDTIINSYISFASSDRAAILPSRYQFIPADAGSHTWSNGFTLMTTGNQTISATIFDASGINGTVTVIVVP